MWSFCSAPTRIVRSDVADSGYVQRADVPWLERVVVEVAKPRVGLSLREASCPAMSARSRAMSCAASLSSLGLGSGCWGIGYLQRIAMTLTRMHARDFCLLVRISAS
jgi:hypothetical protein